VWRQGAGAPGGGEVICHNDVAHYNTVFRAGRPVAFIDWDFAAPGPRAWDLAYAAYRFVPMAHDEHAPVFGVPLPVDRPGRLRRLCDAYGLDDRGGFVDVLLGRIEAVCDLIVDQAAKGDPAFRQFLAEGHVAGYRRDLRLIESLRDRLARALG
jgi:aminoglycoside phosphotransferase (APT) family kinase protein